MTTTNVTEERAQALTPSVLNERWQALRAENPGMYARNAASELGVSEGELVAARVGLGVLRLAGAPSEWVHALAEVGEVMALTRNEHCVIEKTGRFDGISIHGNMGVVLDPQIDLRLFLRRWAHAFALREATRDGDVRESLQFFDVDGTAVHKVFRTKGTDTAAWSALVERFADAEQEPGLEVRPAPPLDPETRTDAEIDVDAFREEWRALEDTHHFFGLVKRHGVSRTQALRLGPPEMVREVPAAAWRTVMESAAEREVPIMIFVGSPGCLEIHTGPIRRIVERGPWWNILDPGLQVHLRQESVASCWVVRKPTVDGIVTSVELFDAEGGNIAMLFGERKPGKPELESWRAVVAGIETGA